ncbi:hypothetical protein K458DRAFT_388112 [Lentithecium fluviatile CBS 122367]|uniref:Uncharacterized protein n=1 Tax=Lentithecium fluviatile CBS 122367 TaxID=1168545 RepID=A0A6G1J516_9PLEO|nr:hypothetical protein K458DRAFT_388112 [Lentithecium fluviatile CBS 122367]
MLSTNVQYSLHDAMLQHCQQCNGFKKKWRIVDESVQPVLHETIVHEPSSHSEYATKFIDRTPTPEGWSQRQLEVVHNAKTYQIALSSLFTRDCGTGPTLESQYPTNLVAIGEQFARLTDSSLRRGKLQKSFSYFQALILLLYSAVLEKTGTDRRDVDTILDSVPTFGSKNKTSLRKAAWKVYEVIEKLVKAGWTMSRATELFFLNPISPSSLSNMKDKCFDSIATVLVEKQEYTTYKYEDCMTTEYTIPSLIAYLLSLGDATRHINRMYSALNIEVPKTLHHVHDVHPAVTLMSTNIYTVSKPPRKKRKPNIPITKLESTATNNASGGGDNSGVHLRFNPTADEALNLAPTTLVLRKGDYIDISTIDSTRSNDTTGSGLLKTLTHQTPSDAEATGAGSTPPGIPGPAEHPNMDHLSLGLGGVEDQQAGSGAVQGGFGAGSDYPDGCGTGSVTEGAGENFDKRYELGGRAAATRVSPTVRNSCKSTSDPPPLPTTPTNGFQTPDIGGARGQDRTMQMLAEPDTIHELGTAERHQDGTMNTAQETRNRHQLEMAASTLLNMQTTRSLEVHSRDG